jgi:putrescine aminotransferase
VIAAANEELVHGYTYSGHPVASAVALKNIEIIEKEKLVDRVREDVGPYFQSKLRELFDGHPLVGEVRGIGLLAAIELVKDKSKREFYPRDQDIGSLCRNHCFANGLVMRAIRDTMVLAPPFIISRDEIDELLRLARRCIDLTSKELGRF